ncbi:MAG: hypothetical protein VR72_07365 [Clostridiaceae bacterium BRH_c20a]|nr:MAG: hypothetical protein VR72_07365 [Clostridiaceae bacterium BRH_c20a]
MDYIIITGASKGLGRALAKEVAEENVTLILIARNKCELDSLVNEISGINVKIYTFNFDLLDYEKLELLMSRIFLKVDLNNCNKITFINNAGTINPICHIGELDMKDIKNNLVINCLSPVLILNQFVDFCNTNSLDSKIINISSGAYKKPIEGWSLYSASKAAVHMIIETIAEENKNNPLMKIASIDPGIMDTNIQREIRETSKYQFSGVEKFIEFYQDKKLRSPMDVAKTIKKFFINDWKVDSIYEKLDKYIWNE